MNASTNRVQISNFLRALKKNTPEAKEAREELAKLLKPELGSTPRRAKKLYIAAHVGRPFGVSGVMVNRLALDHLQLQDPKYGETYVKCVGAAKEETTRGIDAFMYTHEGIKKVREEIPKALKKGLIKTMAHKPAPLRKTFLNEMVKKNAA